jgi:hypothetical protein
MRRIARGARLKGPQVLGDRGVFQLERALREERDARVPAAIIEPSFAAAHEDAPCVRADDAEQEVEQRRLSSAVRAEDGQAGPRRDRDRDVAERGQSLVREYGPDDRPRLRRGAGAVGYVNRTPSRRTSVVASMGSSISSRLIEAASARCRWALSSSSRA